MRRVVSYGGPCGVPASQRLKQKLSSSAGMQLVCNNDDKNNLSEELWFLTPPAELHSERVLHRTSRATINFLATASALKGDGKGQTRKFRKYPSECVDRSMPEQQTQCNIGGESVPRAVAAPAAKELVSSFASAQRLVTNSRETELVPSPPDRKQNNVTDVTNDTVSSAHSIDSTNTTAVVIAVDDIGDGYVMEAGCSGSERSAAFSSDHSNTSPLGNPPSFGSVVVHGRIPSEEPSGSEGAHLKPSANELCDQLLEGSSVDTSSNTLSKSDRALRQDLGSVSRAGDYSEVSSSQLVPNSGEGTEMPERIADEADSFEQDGVDDVVCDEPVVDESRSGSDCSLVSSEGDHQKHESTERMTVAALNIQSYWRGWLQRRRYELLNSTVLEKQRQNFCSAAIVYQKHWRGVQSRRLVKYLKMEQTVKERAAIVIQSHMRGHKCRCQLKNLSSAAITLQTGWRHYRASRKAESAVVIQRAFRDYMNRKRRLGAALLLQACARGYLVRCELMRMHKAATIVQHNWKKHRQSLGSEAAIKIQAYVRAFLVRKQNSLHREALARGTAATFIQAYARGHLVRCKLSLWHYAASTIQLNWRTFSHNRHLQAVSSSQSAYQGVSGENPLHCDGDTNWDLQCEHSHLELQSGGANVVNNVVVSDAADQHNVNAEVRFWKGEGTLEVSGSTSLIGQEMVLATVKQMNSPLVEAGLKECELVSSIRKGDSSSSPHISSDSSPVIRGQEHVRSPQQQEDWNEVAVDNLDECLDTCLAALRPLPTDLSGSSSVEQCLSKFDISDGVQQQKNHDESRSSFASGSRDSFEGSFPSKPHITLPCTHEQDPRASLDMDVIDKGSWHVLDIPSTDHSNGLSFSCGDGPQSVPGSTAKRKTEYQVQDSRIKDQGKSRQIETLKRNEERLQQFAQVFLLQRQIAYQQQRAQSAPPFPPSLSSGYGFPPPFVSTQGDPSCNPCPNDGNIAHGADLIAVRKVHCDATSSSSAERRHYAQDAVYCVDVSSVRQPLVGKQNSGVPIEQVRQTQGTDVVVDMVLLLRKIEEVYGTSHGEEVVASDCFPSRYDDIEGGLSEPLMGNRMNSALTLPKSLRLKHIGIPNVNAMLLVLIAMVVYTRTICQGVIFGTRQTSRKS